MLGICVTAVVACVEAKAAAWLLILFGVASAVTVLLYLCAYLYCLVKDRDALRTETYSIQKLALEKGYVGDKLTGLIENRRAVRALGEFTTGSDEAEQ